MKEEHQERAVLERIEVDMNYNISQRAAALSPSLTLAIDAKAKQMKAEGLDVVSVSGRGSRTLTRRSIIKDVPIRALLAGKTKYEPTPGTAEARQAIADKLKRENNLPYEANQTIVSVGGKHALYVAFMAVLNPGDEVIIPAPYWVSYPEMVKLAGAKSVIVETTDQAEFKVTPDQLRAAITSRTRLFILNSPSNPTGTVYTPEEVKALGNICVEKNVLIMSDGIYEHLLYDGATHKSVASFGPTHFEYTIIVHGFAKAWSMTGWRLDCAPHPNRSPRLLMPSKATARATRRALPRKARSRR